MMLKVASNGTSGSTPHLPKDAYSYITGTNAISFNKVHETQSRLLKSKRKVEETFVTIARVLIL